MVMSLPNLLLLFVIAAVCGAIGRAIAGGTPRRASAVGLADRTGHWTGTPPRARLGNR